jgi:hypothetical protein
MIFTVAETTSVTFSIFKLPILYKIIWLSAVNILFGLMLLGCFKLPSKKSSSVTGIA